MGKWITLLVFFSCFSIFAQDNNKILQTYKVVQNNTIQKVVIVSSENVKEIMPNEKMLVEFEDGEQCILNVLSIENNLAVLSSENCKSRNKIKKEMSLEKVIIPDSIRDKVGSETDIDNKGRDEDKKNSVVEIKNIHVGFTPIDLMPFPDAHKFHISGSIDFSGTEYSWEYLGANVLKGESNETSVGVEGIYSFTSNFLAGFELAYSKEKNKTKLRISSSETETKSDGIEDPSFLAGFRVLDSKTNPVNLDVTFTISPKLQDEKQASTTKDGNAGKGGTNWGIDASVGEKQNGIEWMIGASFLHIGDSESKDQDDSSLTKSNSYNQILIGGEVQWHFNELTAVKLGLGVFKAGEMFVDYGSSGNLLYESGEGEVIEAGIAYKISNNTYFFSDFAYTWIGERKITDDENDSVMQTDQRSWNISVGTKICF